MLSVGCTDYILPEDTFELDRHRNDQSGDVVLRLACIGDNRTSWEVTCRTGTWTTGLGAPVDCAHAQKTAVHDLASAVRVPTASTTNQGPSYFPSCFANTLKN